MSAFSDIPAHVRDSFTPQMRRVVEHQLNRLERVPQQTAPQLSTEPAAGVSMDKDHAASVGAETAAARAEYRNERSFWNAGGPVMHQSRDFRIPAAGTDVPVRMHRSSAEESLPAIVYFHGGGFVLGDLETHDRITRVLAAVSGAAVIAVDYSLAPEAKFPQALYESAGIITHLAVQGEQYGIDGSRLAVAGDSAGAVLSLGATLLLRDEPERLGIPAAHTDQAFDSLRAMLLYYGSHGLADSVSKRLYGGFWDGMSAEELDTIYELFLTKPNDGESPYVNHLSADLDSSLPPAYVIAAELDPLRDDSVLLGKRLELAGHDVQWRVVPGVLHSFLHFGRMLDQANEAIAGGAMFARSRFF